MNGVEYFRWITVIFFALVICTSLIKWRIRAKRQRQELLEVARKHHEEYIGQPINVKPVGANLIEALEQERKKERKAVNDA